MFVLVLALVFALIVLAIWVVTLGVRVSRLERDVAVLQLTGGAAAAVAVKSAPAAAAAATAAAPVPSPPVPVAAPAPPPAAPPRAPRQPWLTGGRALAVAGGGFVLVGVATFVTMAISNGWIDHLTQVLLGYAFGVLVAAAGIAAGRRWGHNAATLVAVGLGVGIVEVVNVAGVDRYSVIGDILGLVIAMVAGGFAVWWAIRRDSQLLAGFGLAVGLAAPLLVDADPTGATLALLSVAFVGAVIVTAARGWPWLGSVMIVVLFPQVGVWVADDTRAPLAIALLSFGWWAGLVTGAIVYDIRNADGRLRSASATLVFFAAIATVGVLEIGLSGDAVTASLLMLAVFHGVAAVMLVAACGRLASRAAAVWLAIAGMGVLALAIGHAFDATARSPFWALEAVALLAARCRYRDLRAGIAAAAFTALAFINAAWASPPRWVFEPQHASVSDTMVAVLPLVLGSAVGLWIAFAYAGGRLKPLTGIDPSKDRLVAPMPVIWIIVTLLAVSSLWLGGTLGAVWAGAAGRAIAFTVIALLAVACVPRRPALVATLPAIALLALASLDVVSELLTPAQLWHGAGDAQEAVLGAALLVGSWLVAALVARRSAATAAVLDLRRTAAVATAATALYASSCLLVTALSSDPGTGTSQAAQLGLSTWWGLVAIVAIGVGLRRRWPVVHRSGAVLLVVAAAKVLVVDTQQLDAGFRVAVFIGIGLLMLLGGWAYVRGAAVGDDA